MDVILSASPGVRFAGIGGEVSPLRESNSPKHPAPHFPANVFNFHCCYLVQAHSSCCKTGQ